MRRLARFLVRSAPPALGVVASCGAEPEARFERATGIGLCAEARIAEARGGDGRAFRVEMPPACRADLVAAIRSVSGVDCAPHLKGPEVGCSYRTAAGAAVSVVRQRDAAFLFSVIE